MTHASWYQAAVKAVDEFLEEALPTPDNQASPLHAAMRYSVLPGGKRLRPVLCMAAYSAVAEPELDFPPPAALWPAASVELIHCYSLVHDDLPCMDDDDFRRGHPSCHRAFGEAHALLAGDALLTMAFELLSEPEFAGMVGAGPALACVRELALASGSLGMVGGQALELCTVADDFAGDLERAIEAVDTVQALKTGKLFEAAMRMGALTAGAGIAELQAITDFAVAFGKAFQIADDLEDAESQDAAQGTLTTVQVCGPEGARTRMFELAAEARQAAESLGERSFRLIDILNMIFPSSGDE